MEPEEIEPCNYGAGFVRTVIEKVDPQRTRALSSQRA